MGDGGGKCKVEGSLSDGVVGNRGDVAGDVDGAAGEGRVVYD